MAHIHEKIDFTVALLVVHNGKILLIHHRNLNKWLPLGGHIELDEDPEAAALREAREESGQSMKIVKVGPLIEYLDAYGRAVAVPFILRSDLKKELVPSEHSEYRWIKLSEAKGYDIVPDLSKALSLFGLVRRAPLPASAKAA